MRYSKSYRVLRLYTWLEQRKTISLSGTAADFGIDERTVQRDIADIRAFLADFNTETGKRRTISYNREKDSYVMKIDGMEMNVLQKFFVWKIPRAHMIKGE